MCFFVNIYQYMKKRFGCLLIIFIIFCGFISPIFYYSKADTLIEYQIDECKFFYENYVNQKQIEFILKVQGDNWNIWIDFLLQWELDAEQYSAMVENIDSIDNNVANWRINNLQR